MGCCSKTLSFYSPTIKNTSISPFQMSQWLLQTISVCYVGLGCYFVIGVYLYVSASWECRDEHDIIHTAPTDTFCVVIILVWFSTESFMLMCLYILVWIGKGEYRKKGKERNRWCFYVLWYNFLFWNKTVKAKIFVTHSHNMASRWTRTCPGNLELFVLCLAP